MFVKFFQFISQLLNLFMFLYLHVKKILEKKFLFCWVYSIIHLMNVLKYMVSSCVLQVIVVWTIWKWVTWQNLSPQLKNDSKLLCDHSVVKRNHRGLAILKGSYLKNPLSASKFVLQYNFHSADTNSCIAEGPQMLSMPASWVNALWDQKSAEVNIFTLPMALYLCSPIVRWLCKMLACS